MLPETKDIGSFTAEIKAVANEKGTYDITMSVPTEDRDGEIIDAKAFEPLPAWIPIDIDHAMTVLDTVGSGSPAYEGSALKLNDFTFASTPTAQVVKSLVDEKHIRKMSVAFMNPVREVDKTDGKVHIRKAELLNAGIVAVPSNREADIVLAGKSIDAFAGRRMVPLKAIAGSYEERTDNLREALRLAHPEARWLWVRATFDGSVVFEVEDQLGSVTTYQSTYAIEGDAYTVGDAEPVDIAEVVQPAKSESADDTKSPDTTPEDEAAAPAAAIASPAAGAVAKAHAAMAEAALLLTA